MVTQRRGQISSSTLTAITCHRKHVGPSDEAGHANCKLDIRCSRPVRRDVLGIPSEVNLALVLMDVNRADCHDSELA